MSIDDQPSPPAAPESARPDVVPAEPVTMRSSRSSATPRQPRPRGGGTLALALLLALIAVAASGYIGWRQWQQEQGGVADSASLARLQQRTEALQASVDTLTDERGSLDKRLGDAATVNRSLREELLGQAERTRNLEDAVAKLSEKSLSGHDATLLDETESLLRMAAERYTLFHDAQGAAAAYALADQTLAAVNDGAYSGLRQSIAAEREALAKSQPATQASALQQLTDLRGKIATLPLKPLDTQDATQATDTWSRVRHALASVITIQRDNGAPLAVADARFARELAELDLAHAQAALLAYDAGSYAAALQRVDEALANQFDGNAATVQQARSSLKQLASALPALAPVQLGEALTELRNMRAVHVLQPAISSSSAKPADGAQP